MIVRLTSTDTMILGAGGIVMNGVSKPTSRGAAAYAAPRSNS